MRRIIICGDRNWSDAQLIDEIVSGLESDTAIIEGMAKGADTLAGRAARKYGLELLEFPALWGRYGRAAGPMRNKQMIVEGGATEILAFHNNILASLGTKDMIKQALKAKLPVYLHYQSGGRPVRWIGKDSIG